MKHGSRKRIYIRQICGMGVIPALCAAMLSGCGAAKSADEPEGFSDIAFGTIVTARIYSDDDADMLMGDISDILTHIEYDEISWREDNSEIARINALSGTGEVFQTSDELYGLLNDCDKIYEKTGGAFDISLGRLTRLWNIDALAGEEIEAVEAKFMLPSDMQIQEALAKSGMEYVDLGEDGKIALDNDIWLDMGAVGKGYAFDEVRRYLDDTGFDGAMMLSLGGSIMLIGDKPDGTAWRIGVVDPFDTGAQAGTLTLRGGYTVSTSGDYERYITVNGERYHHIMDPDTGYPANSGVRSVTIVSKSGVLSDALSTACFVAGEKKGMLILESFEDTEGLFILDNGGIVMTKGMEDIWER